MSLTAAVNGFVFLLCVQVIQGHNDWGVTYSSTDICALKGSTVEISCRYRYSFRTNGRDTTVQETFWFTKWKGNVPVDLRRDSQYSGRVQHSCYVNICTLRIRDLRESDSAEYKFGFITNQPYRSFTGSPGVTLSVTDPDLQVRVEGRYLYPTWADLTCVSSCQLPDHPSYIWYKNGQKVPAETSSSYSGNFNSADSYSCAVRGQEAFPSPPVCANGQTCNRVTYTHRSVCALKGSSVDISCTYNSHNQVQSKFWFSPECSHQWQSPSQPEDLSEDSQFKGRVQVLEPERGRSTLRITDLRESDSAKYKFRFITNQPYKSFTGSPGVTLSVTDLQVKGGKQYSYSRWADLTCVSSCQLPDLPSYIWYRNGQKVPAETSSSYSGNFNSADSYSCAVRGQEAFPSPPVCAIGQTCNRVTYTHRSICALKGSSVDISCTYNSHNQVQSKFWFSPKRSHQWQSPSQRDPQYRVQVLEPERGRSTLRITDLRESDSAEYHFKFKAGWFVWTNSLPGTTLTVTALQVQVIRKTDHLYYTEAELKCHSSCSPAACLSYVWFKNGLKMQEQRSYYTDNFNPSDIISCALKGHEDYSSPPVYAPKLPSVSVSPSGEIMEGSSVTLTCSSDANPAANYTWFKENVNVKPPSEDQHLIFRSIQSSDSGEYYCTAENELGTTISKRISIDVKYAPKTSALSVSPSGEIVEGSSVNLTCSSDANPAASYTWYKENQKLIQGPEAIYHLTLISLADSGNYHCKSENEYDHINSTSVRIEVLYAPRLPSVSVSPSGEIVEGSSVNLTCSSDANPAANYTWYKENDDSPKASGQIFIITDVGAEHSGSYYCEAQNRQGCHNSTLFLIVVSGSMKSVAAGSITAILLVIIFLFAILLIRRKRFSKQTTERTDNRTQLNMGLVCGNPSAAVQRAQAEEQDDLCYASVSFSKNQEDPLYSNISAAQLNRHKNEEEEEGDKDTVEYTVVNVKPASASPELRRPEDVEDLSALYSTVSKTARV